MAGTRITSAEAARRLGVKVETLYAYVSRGHLTSHRVPGRPSSFDLGEVEALRATGTRHRPEGSAAFRFPSVTTRITDRGDGWLRYRGHDVADLCHTHTFEQVVGLLWHGAPQPVPASAAPSIAIGVRDLLAALPRQVDTASRLRLAVAAAAAFDPNRNDLRDDAVDRAGATALSCLLDAATPPHRNSRLDDVAETVGDRLWTALAGPRADPRLRSVLHSALILLADHGLATSTVAARAAASARAHPYAVIGAGLATLEGPSHGAGDSAVHRLLRDAFDALATGQPLGDIVSQHRGPNGTTPGLADPHPKDIRADALMTALENSGAADTALDAARAVRTLVDPDQSQQPNIELALAVLATASAMPLGATATITSIARCAGWVAHAIEEYREPVLRWRANEVYTGPSPTSGHAPCGQ